MQPSYAEQYDLLEGQHWYFRARRKVLQSLLAALPWPAAPRILEIGCGPGHNLVEIYPPGADLVGVEPEELNARRAAARSGLPVHCATIEHLPSAVADASFDAVCLFDVLEHIQDDAQALCIIHRKLKPGGLLAIGVPACPWMWGPQDVVNQHFRRYTRSGLSALVAAAGFQILRGTYYNSFLFPPVALVRLFSFLRRGKPAATGDFAIAGDPASPILYGLFASEARWLRHLDFCFGVSVFLAARKPES